MFVPLRHQTPWKLVPDPPRSSDKLPPFSIDASSLLPVWRPTIITGARRVPRLLCGSGHTSVTTADANSANTTHASPTSPTTTSDRTGPCPCAAVNGCKSRYADQGDNSARLPLEAHPDQPQRRCDERQQRWQHEGGKDEQPDSREA